MINDYSAFSATEVGYNHVKAGKVCEDASDFYDDEIMHLCVVADGHGSDNYPRTDKGSRMAVDSAIKCAVDFVKAADTKDVLSDEKHGFPMLLQLTKSILMDWHESVRMDFQSNPFTDLELRAVSEKYRKRYLSKDESIRCVEKAYGCTLILFVVTAGYSFGLQIGDGKCVLVNNNGQFMEPIPWDENCQLNVTTSICDYDSLNEFRFYITEELPAAVFCGSDGIDDSYSNPEEMYALYRSILKIFYEHGSDIGKNEIVEYLPILTKKGSGDDVSIGLIYNLKKIRRLKHRFELQALLFNLTEEVSKKRQKINTYVEKDKAIRIRLTRFLDSGKKPSDRDWKDFQSLGDICKQKEIIEGEISEIESQIQELDRNLNEEVNEWSDYFPDNEEIQNGLEGQQDDVANDSVSSQQDNRVSDEQEKTQILDDKYAENTEDYPENLSSTDMNYEEDNESIEEQDPAVPNHVEKSVDTRDNSQENKDGQTEGTISVESEVETEAMTNNDAGWPFSALNENQDESGIISENLIEGTDDLIEARPYDESEINHIDAQIAKTSIQENEELKSDQLSAIKETTVKEHDGKFSSEDFTLLNKKIEVQIELEQNGNRPDNSSLLKDIDASNDINGDFAEDFLLKDE